MKQHVGPHLVGTYPSIPQILLAAGIEAIPADKLEDYKRKLVAAHPGTRLGEWLHRKMMPIGLITLAGALLAVACFFGGMTLLMVGMNETPDLLNAAELVAGVVLAFMSFPIGLFFMITTDLLPSYWVRVRWPDEIQSGLEAINIHPMALAMHEQILTLASPRIRFEIDVFYKNGVSEDPISYVVDTLDGSVYAFAVWKGSDWITL